MANPIERFTTGEENRTRAFNDNEGMDEGDNEDTGGNNITQAELELLDNAGSHEPADDDGLLAAAQLDNVDEDGEKLNEETSLTGEDLDVPGSETDDDSESIGEEDEENNSYSVSDQDDDNESDI